MKILLGKHYSFFILVFLGLMIFASVFPLLVEAKTCYVNDNSESDGDGTKSSPYATISEALDSDKCDRLKVKKGKYEESFVLRKGVDLCGEGSRTVIDGKIKMRDDTSLCDIYIKNGGVEVLKGAGVKIDNVRIEKSRIGIVTNGTGKLVLQNSTISHNGKGLYLQYGKDVEIKNNEIISNSEEGVDIRANVDGIIIGNVISKNKEGGIEVIAGKSQLTISKNVIKYNKASGIAIQFYKENDELGKLKISGNSLISNRNYGVDCKIPSGGRPSGGYWSRSVNFDYNRVSGNGKGDFSSFCGFTGGQLLQATKTKEELEALKNKTAKNEGEQEDKTTVSGEQEVNNDSEKNDEEKEVEVEKDKEMRNAEKLKEDISEQEKSCRIAQNNLREMSEKNKWKIFLFGPEQAIIDGSKKEKEQCEESVEEVTQKILSLKANDLKSDLLDNELATLKQAQVEFEKEVYSYESKFGIWKWLKSHLFGWYGKN